ncbi:MAG: hypothetical protein ACK5VV_09380 [Lysobacteraceae bacterium]|jgi:hypothetical protein|nr:hypothetical protein [Xanthomonadaceae bacterium]MCZ8318857.1 hypothetical protein [Silanimonas sp.]
MNRHTLLAAAVAATLVLAGCQADIGEKSAPKQDPNAAALVAPATDDDAAWKAYLGQVIGQNMDGVTERTFNYYLPAGTDPTEEEGPYQRMKADVNAALLRTVLPGNMLTFSSPNSTMMADLVVAAFEGEELEEDALKGSRVLFIGESKDESRVRQAALSVGAEFRFVEVKR